MNKDALLDFIKPRSLMVISSVSAQGAPEAALVGFAETENFELIFRTSGMSRKFANIADNGVVAVVIGWDGLETVQYEGTAKELSSKESERLTELYFQKHPHLRDRKLEDERFFLVSPKWIRYTSLTANPWDVFELKF